MRYRVLARPSLNLILHRHLQTPTVLTSSPARSRVRQATTRSASPAQHLATILDGSLHSRSGLHASCISSIEPRCVSSEPGPNDLPHQLGLDDIQLPRRYR